MEQNKRNFRKLWAVPVAAVVALTSFVAPSGAVSPNVAQASPTMKTELPLGKENLKETLTTTQIQPGLVHTRIVRGERSEKDVYIVDVSFSATREGAEAIAKRLRSEGYNPRVERISERAHDDPTRGPLGYLVRVGSFHSESDAVTLKDDLMRKGYEKSRVVYSGEDGGQTTGPWVVNVLEVDPTEFKGKIVPVLGTDIVPGKEKLTSISARTGALAAVNGGYFVVGANDGTEGDLAGVSMIGGNLISEAVNGRTSLILSDSGKNARIASVKTLLTAVSSDGSKREADGLNRKPGFIRGCGGVDDTTDLPKHDFTCTDTGELIQFTPAFGKTTEPGEGVEVVLNAAGQVIEFRERRGGSIPSDGAVLSGTGDAADWLRSHAKAGSTIQMDTRLFADGLPFQADGSTGMVNGGPRLLRDGEVNIPAMSEGFHWTDNPEFFYRFGVRRNPRTLAGVTTDGKILLVTVDGRKPGYSVGASFEESARIMKSLGATDAVNLDGGGSTAMTVGSQLVNRPSDPIGERTIGDAIVILP